MKKDVTGFGLEEFPYSLRPAAPIMCIIPFRLMRVLRHWELRYTGSAGQWKPSIMETAGKGVFRLMARR